ncbi:MAG: 23S rRNA (adenine(2503)-C(2))-methyltransferase RlmN [Deltaproteobacteria bacterium]|nr:23S rRNA (adenine(2503)-C(2))-methyltransferase RlmN [Deltaproteobacteria bacterium]
MEPFFNLTLNELEHILGVCGKEKFRARQLFKWIYNKFVLDFELMTDIPKSLRKIFKEMFSFTFLNLESMERSKDGSTKFAFRTHDGYTVESVLMPEEDRTTLCVSTQIGCKMGCRFCVTGKIGFIRNLTTDEIVSQMMSVKKLTDTTITNVVFMGMGEPMDNVENVIKAIQIFGSPYGLNLSKRKITVSTSGLIDTLKTIPQNLCVIAISLNAADDEKRTYLMPINRIYPLETIVDFARSYRPDKRSRITFEYVIIGDINDSGKDAEKLADLLSGVKCKINIIPYNESKHISFKTPSDEKILNFQRILLKRGYTATIRKSKGQDVSAACGLLGSRYLEV